MLRYKAIQILKTFNDEEVKKFHLFLISPFFNKSKKVTELFDILHKKFHPHYDSEKLTNEYLLKQIKTDKLSTLKNLFADLYKLLFEFLGYSSSLKNGTGIAINTINELESRCLFSIANTEIEEIERKIKNSDYFQSDNLLQLYKLELSKFNVNTFEKTFKDYSFIKNNLEYVSKSNEYLFQYFFLSSSQGYILTCDLAEQMEIPVDKTEFGNLFNNFFSEQNISKYLISKSNISNTLYRKVIELKWLYILIGKNINRFENSVKYVKLLKSIWDKIDLDERFVFYSVYRFWHPDLTLNKDFREYEFEFYDNFFEAKAYKSTGHYKINFRNIYYFLTRSDGIGRFDWADNLIENIKDEIDETQKDSIFAYRNVLKFLHRDKQPAKAFEELNKVKDFGNLQIKRDIKFYYVLISYDLKQFNSTLSYLENLSKFLNRKDIPKIQKTFFKDFIKILRFLVKQKLNNSKIETDVVLNQIDKAKHMPQKSWIKDKVNSFNVE